MELNTEQYRYAAAILSDMAIQMLEANHDRNRKDPDPEVEAEPTPEKPKGWTKWAADGMKNAGAAILDKTKESVSTLGGKVMNKLTNTKTGYPKEGGTGWPYVALSFDDTVLDNRLYILFFLAAGISNRDLSGVISHYFINTDTHNTIKKLLREKSYVHVTKKDAYVKKQIVFQRPYKATVDQYINQKFTTCNKFKLIGDGESFTLEGVNPAGTGPSDGNDSGDDDDPSDGEGDRKVKTPQRSPSPPPVVDGNPGAGEDGVSDGEEDGGIKTGPMPATEEKKPEAGPTPATKAKFTSVYLIDTAEKLHDIAKQNTKEKAVKILNDGGFEPKFDEKPTLINILKTAIEAQPVSLICTCMYKFE